MKKIAVFLSVLSLLAASGCSNAENAAESDTPAETNFSIIVEELPEISDTAASESETTAVSETVTETTAETIAEMTISTEASDTETSASAEAVSTAETFTQPENTADLLGTWEYVDGYRFRFMEGNAAEMQVDFSGTMTFTEDKLYYNGTQYIPTVMDENVSVKLDDGTTLLRLTALDRYDTFTFNGRYRLEECWLYSQITDGISPEESPVYYVEVNSNTFRLVTKAEYHASPDGVLQLVQGGDTLTLHYEVDAVSLKITDETGAQDILKRVE